MERLKKIIFANTLKRRVLTFTLVLLICFMIGILYTFFITSTINSKINQMFSTSILLNDLAEDMKLFEVNLEQYLSTKSSDSFVSYLDQYGKLQNYGDQLNYGNSKNQSHLQLTNIHYLLEAYLNASESAIEFKRARNTEKYLEQYSEILMFSDAIHLKIEQLESRDFQSNLENYLLMTESFKSIRLNFVVIVALLAILSLIFVYSFATKVTQPIEALSAQAEAISKGQYSVSRIEGKHFKEAEVLKQVFLEMAEHIEEYIKELEDKVETENKLRLSETEKLKIQNLLNQAELLALQSQINPHFLFNTLNAGMQLAIIENADRTVFFLDHLSQLFRYNIQSLENRVKLSEELKNVKNYYELMKIRFGNQLQMHLDAEPNTMGIEMPPLILQPLIENALIHGFQDKMDVGIINLQVRLSGNEVEIIISDNGEGIPENKLKRLQQLDFKKSENNKSGHTTGLGLENVYERLKHFYGKKDVFRIQSTLKQGTQITLVLPVQNTTNEVTYD